MAYFDRGDILEAHYWYGTHYSGGQWSPEYERACRASERYNPGPLCNGPSTENAAEIYNELEKAGGHDPTPFQVLPSGAVYFPSWDDANLILSDARGRYIPRDFCADIDESDCERLGINWSDVQTCQAGPDQEWYWEAWTAILDACRFVDSKGIAWVLHQDGDLWEVPEGAKIPEF